MSSSSGGTSSIPAGEAAADEPSTSSDVQQDATTPFVRLSKAEKRARRAELAVEKRRLWRLRQKEIQHAAVASRAEARAAKLAAMDETERAAFEAADRAERDRLYAEKVEQNRRVEDAFAGGGLRVALDLSYGERMRPKEQTSLARQLSRCWGANRRASQPVSLHLAGLGTCPSGCLPPPADVERWRVHRHDADVVSAFPTDELVFLSPDADEAIASLDKSRVYVIGGLVDSNVQKHTSLEKANKLGARTMRLPLAEHAPSANPRLPLTLTAVLEILLAVNAGSDWASAINTAVAPRHLRQKTWETGRGARRQESRARAAASWGIQPKRPPPQQGGVAAGEKEGEEEEEDGGGSSSDGDELERARKSGEFMLIERSRDARKRKGSL